MAKNPRPMSQWDPLGSTPYDVPERVLKQVREQLAMKVNGIKCDICDKIYDIDPTIVGELPLGWFMLTKGSDGLVEQPMHFCSLECLRLWIPKHPVASEFVQDEEPKVTLSDRVY